MERPIEAEATISSGLGLASFETWFLDIVTRATLTFAKTSVHQRRARLGVLGRSFSRRMMARVVLYATSWPLDRSTFGVVNSSCRRKVIPQSIITHYGPVIHVTEITRLS